MSNKIYPEWAMLATDVRYITLPPNTSCLVQPKLNGVRAKWDHELKLFISRTGHQFPRHVIPHLYDLYAKQINPDASLDGELYVHKMPLQKLHGLLAQNRIEGSGNSSLIDFCPFDIINPNFPCFARLDALNKLNLPCAVPYSKECIKESPYMKDALVSTIKLGYEGLILRDPDAPYIVGRTPAMIKVKPLQHSKVRIMGFLEGCGKLYRAVGAIIVYDSTSQQTFKIGGGHITEDDRIYMWHNQERFMNKLITIHYVERSVDEVPLQAQVSNRLELFPTI